MRAFFHQLVARAILLWLFAWYLAALFGMTAAPAILIWRWFREGLHPGIAAALALMAGTLPIMVGVFAMNRGGWWDSKPVWRVWVYGWAVLGGAVFLMLVLE